MKKYGVIPAKDEATVGADYTVELPNNKYLIIDSVITATTYTDESGANHTQINPQVGKRIETDPWQNADRDSVNALWDAIAIPDNFVRADLDENLVGVRYDTLEKYIFDENRVYPIWTDIFIDHFEFTDLGQGNMNTIIDVMFANRANSGTQFKWFVFNREPLGSRLTSLRTMVEENNLQGLHWSDALSDFVLMT